jgi:hypothetical protein
MKTFLFISTFFLLPISYGFDCNDNTKGVMKIHNGKLMFCATNSGPAKEVGGEAKAKAGEHDFNYTGNSSSAAIILTSVESTSKYFAYPYGGTTFEVIIEYNLGNSAVWNSCDTMDVGMINQVYPPPANLDGRCYFQANQGERIRLRLKTTGAYYPQLAVVNGKMTYILTPIE